MDDKRLWVVDILVLFKTNFPVMDVTRINILELRNPFFNVSTVFVNFFTLQFRVKNAEIWLRIDPASRAPLPTSIILARIIVCEFCSKVLFTFLPINVQILDKVVTHNHSVPIRHVSSFVQMPH